MEENPSNGNLVSVRTNLTLVTSSRRHAKNVFPFPQEEDDIVEFDSE
uniref:Uncharacterized protein n=1 Tax=Anguilla anguilla TaxID=7936 RepID=A0A0E9VXL0_ANGAN